MENDLTTEALRKSVTTLKYWYTQSNGGWPDDDHSMIYKAAMAHLTHLEAIDHILETDEHPEGGNGIECPICDGQGYTVDVRPTCCGRNLGHGGCRGDCVEPEQYQVQCAACYGSGKVQPTPEPTTEKCLAVQKPITEGDGMRPILTVYQRENEGGKSVSTHVEAVKLDPFQTMFMWKTLNRYITDRMMEVTGCAEEDRATETNGDNALSTCADTLSLATQVFVDKCNCCSDLYKQIVQGEIDACREILNRDQKSHD